MKLRELQRLDAASLIDLRDWCRELPQKLSTVANSFHAPSGMLEMLGNPDAFLKPIFRTDKKLILLRVQPPVRAGCANPAGDGNEERPRHGRWVHRMADAGSAGRLSTERQEGQPQARATVWSIAIMPGRPASGSVGASCDARWTMTASRDRLIKDIVHECQCRTVHRLPARSGTISTCNSRSGNAVARPS